MTVLRGACALHSVKTHSQYVILTAFPLQQWLQERFSVLRYTYIVLLALSLNFGECTCYPYTVP